MTSGEAARAGPPDGLRGGDRVRQLEGPLQVAQGGSRGHRLGGVGPGEQRREHAR